MFIIKGEKNYLITQNPLEKRISQKFVELIDVFVVDFMPTPICKYASAVRSNRCYSYHNFNEK